jgi:hypothetical protein
VQNGYKVEFVEFPDASLPRYELGSRGIELSLWNWQLQNNGKDGIKLCKEDFKSDFK